MSHLLFGFGIGGPLRVLRVAILFSILFSYGAQAQVSLPEREKLLVQMQKLQRAENRLIERRYRKALRDLNISQEKEYKDWVQFERKARRDFFDAHLKGPERREYIQGYFERKKQMEEGQRTERDLKRLEITRQRQQSLDQLDRNTKLYKEQLLKGEMPPEDLLPDGK